MSKMKQIPGFTDYSITKDGRVWSYKRDKWLRLPATTSGHLLVALWCNNKRHQKYVHRLVLDAYVGSCPAGMECRHLDGNPQNNNFDNLCWGTRSENHYDAVRHGTAPGFASKGEHSGRAKLSEQDVRMIIYTHKTGLFMQKEIANQYSVSGHTIKDIIDKKTWKHIWTT